MVGLAVFGGIALYVAIIWLCVRASESTWLKSAVLFLALAIPFWDLPIGYLNFRSYCESDAELKRLRPLAPQHSVHLASTTGLPVELLLKAGLETIEYDKAGGEGVIQFKRKHQGQVERSEVNKPISKVRVQSKFNESLQWNLVRHEHQLVDNATGEAYARVREYTWKGGWIHNLMSPVLSPPANCQSASTRDLISLAIAGIRM